MLAKSHQDMVLTRSQLELQQEMIVENQEVVEGSSDSQQANALKRRKTNDPNIGHTKVLKSNTDNSEFSDTVNEAASSQENERPAVFDNDVATGQQDDPTNTLGDSGISEKLDTGVEENSQVNEPSWMDQMVTFVKDEIIKKKSDAEKFAEIMSTFLLKVTEELKTLPLESEQKYLQMVKKIEDEHREELQKLVSEQEKQLKNEFKTSLNEALQTTRVELKLAFEDEMKAALAKQKEDLAIEYEKKKKEELAEREDVLNVQFNKQKRLAVSTREEELTTEHLDREKKARMRVEYLESRIRSSADILNSTSKE